MKHKRLTGLEELSINGDGIYCIYPFSSLELGKGCFKIGIATGGTYYQRLEDTYHTYYPMGFYYKNFLEAPPIPENTNKLLHYKEIERFILDNIQGARKVKSKARTHKNGRTEWVFCKQQPLKDVFKLAHETYGGKYHNYELTKDVFQHNENGIKYFEGKINFK